MGWNFYNASGELQINDGGVQAGSAVFTGNVDLGSNLLVGNAGSTGIAISSAGEVTMAAQPAFYVRNAADDTDVTGNDATATVNFDGEIFDQNSDFASDTFTAPVTGRYLLAFGITANGLTASSSLIQVRLVTSNRNIIGWHNDGMPDGPVGLWFLNGSVLCDMDTSDTVTITVNVDGESSNVVDIEGATSLEKTYFCGQLAV